MSTRMKMEKIGGNNDTKIPVDDKTPDKIPSNVIECSVNMSVSLSNAKKSKIFQRTQSLLIVILAIVFAILCFHLKREVRALEVQMNCVNSNLMGLMLRYDKLSKNYNRLWYHRFVNEKLPVTLETTNESDVKISKYRHSLSRQEIKNSSNELNPRNPSTDADGLQRRNATFIDDKMTLDKKLSQDLSGNTIVEGKSIDEGVEGYYEDSDERDRYGRAIVAFERRNHDSHTPIPSIRDDLIDDTIAGNESRAGRSRRDEGRGKKRRKIKRKLKRSHRRLGPLVATFVGAVPEQHVTDTVYVGPWVKSTRNESRYAFNKFHLVEDKTSIEVTANGLYMISAQIYYFGKPTHYSYWILLSSEGTSNTQRVIKCATVSAINGGETSCYTSVVLPLRKGDRLHIQQQEQDRLINLREGHSYVQIMLLSGESSRRRGA